MSNYSEARNRRLAEEAAAARARAREDRLRRLIRDLQIAPADTRSLEQRLASASVARATVERHMSNAATDLSTIGNRMADQAAESKELFGASRHQFTSFMADMERTQAELTAGILDMERQRLEAAQTARRRLDAEVLAEQRHDEDLAARRDELIRRAELVLGDLPTADLGTAGLTGEADILLERIAAVRRVTSDEGVIGARRGLDDAIALASDVRWRTAKVAAFKEALGLEIRQLWSQLEFSAEERRVLVGSAGDSLDAPLRRELDRLTRQIDDQAVHYDSIEHRVRDLSSAIDRVGTEVSRIHGDVQHFDRLNRLRFEIIDHTLPRMLADVVGEAVEKRGETLPDLALKPVEVQYRAPRTGEIIDCSVDLDGSVRVHHHQHTTPRACIESAQRLAEVLPRTMHVIQRPTMDASGPRPQSESPYVVRPLTRDRS